MTIKECVAQLERLKSIYMDAKDIGNFDEYIAALAMAIKILEGSPIEMKPMSDDEQNRLLELLESEKRTIMCLEPPAADVAPVHHGMWLDIDREVWQCSNCGNEIAGYDEIPSEYGVNYCDRYGAKMDGVKE